MKKIGLESLSLVFGSVMILLVVSGAIAITFTDFLSDRLYGNKRVFFVVLLLAYAVYRVIRMRQIIRMHRHEDQSR